MEYIGSVYADDDALWVASSREGIEVRINVANLFLEFMDITFNKEESPVMAVEWQGGEPFDLAREPWRSMVFSSEVAFKGGELRCAKRLDASLVEKGKTVETPAHIFSEAGVAVDVSALDTGVRWLGYQWIPMMRNGVLKGEFQTMVLRLENSCQRRQ